MKEPIRILHILQRMEAAGIQALLMNLYRNIDRTQVQFDFLVVYKEEQFYDKEIEELGGKVYKMSFREDLNLLKFKRELKEFFQIHQEYRVVHCHAYTIGAFCLRAAREAGIPVRIAHSHNSGAAHDLTYLPKIYMRRRFTEDATHLFACSQEAGKYLFGEQHFFLLKNVIDSESFVADETVRREIRRELGVEDCFVAGHVGRFHADKNHDFLLAVFEKIRAERPDAQLILAGAGPLEEKIRKSVAKRGLTDCVHFLGGRKDIAHIYQAMDVFLFPSLSEGLGIVAIEAQAAGIPLLCSKGVPQEVEISPLCKRLGLEEGASAWMKEALLLAEHPLRHTDTRHYVQEAGFDLQAVARTMETLYQEMAGEAQ